MAADEARGLIDEKIAAFERSIRQLKTQRNDLAPISQLPPEILSRIFGFVVIQGDSYSSALQFNFSFVSHCWRATALGAPDLWTYFTMKSIDWASAMLERSKMAPLTVQTYIHQYGTKSNTFVKELLVNHGFRLQELYLTARSPSLLTSLLRDMQLTRSPLLRTVHISGGHKMTSETIHVDLSVGFLSGAEKLRDLHLASCTFDWKTTPFSALTNLLIHRCSTSTSFSDFVDALRQATALESLDLSDSLPWERAAATVGKVTLPQLHTFRLSSPFNKVASVAGLFVIPAATTVYINCTSIPEGKEQVSSFISSISALVSTLRTDTKDNVSFRELGISDCSDRGLSLKAWSQWSVPQTYFNTNSGPSSPHLSLTTQVSLPLTASTILSELVHSLPVANLGKLSLYTGLYSLKYDTLVKTFGSLTHLSHIFVQCASLRAVTLALQHKTENYETSRSDFFQVAFPKLTVLEIDQGIFSGLDLDGVNFDDFQEMLIERCERKAPLQTLTIVDSYEIDEGQVELLEEIVVDVYWDECEQSYGDEEDESEPDYEDGDIDYNSEFDDDYGDPWTFGGLY